MSLFMYHITKAKYLPSIKIEGIIADKEKGLTLRRYQKKWHKVFLTNNHERILRDQIGYDYFKKHEWVMLMIITEGLEIEPMEYNSSGTYTLSDFEFVCDHIPVDKIHKVIPLDHNSWDSFFNRPIYTEINNP